MEFVLEMFVRRISNADFNNMYSLKVPKSGGGQTYIDAAGVKSDDLEKFLEWGSSEDVKFKDTRKSHTIKAKVLGSEIVRPLNFYPRNHRNNFTIARQTMKDRHPAWSPDNGFPSLDKEHYSKEAVDSLTANLLVYILKTTGGQYYASFLNSEKIPKNWPEIEKLKQITNIKNAEIIEFGQNELEFINDKNCPFRIPKIPAILDVSEVTEEDFEMIDNVDVSHIDLEEYPIPNVRSSTKPSRKTKPVKKDWLKEEKIRLKIGELGEKIVYNHEKKYLNEIGRPDLSEKVEWTSKEVGDGTGYDIVSFNKNGTVKYIEVKSTTGPENTAFNISSGELRFSSEHPGEYALYRVYDLDINNETAKFYIISDDLEERCEIVPVNYTVLPKNE